VIYQGKVLVDGTPDEVKMHPKVREEYLGDLDAAARTAASRAGDYESDDLIAVGSASGNAVPTPHIGKSMMRRVTDV
jgi:lipopolysaccharide export system ATP-binding protein